MTFDIGEYEHHRGRGPFGIGNVPGFAGISFGRSSAIMGALLHPSIVKCFENTGREHQKSLEFGCRLEDAYKQEIIWLEWRPPPRVGDPPIKFQFERVTYETATKRSNDLIQGLLEYLNAYHTSLPCVGPKRQGCQGLKCMCGGTGRKPPLTPWARSRLCTAYLKHRTQRKYIESLHGERAAYDSFVGLRHDEPDRIAALLKSETQMRAYYCPLDYAKITKPIVNAIMARQPFDLELEHDYQGNCTGCFLKDEADRSRAMGEWETDADGWIELQERFPGFGGRSTPSYAQLRDEREMRLKMEAFWKGETALAPINDGTMSPRRFRLVMLQEKKRAREGSKGFSCSCEGAVELADNDAALDEVA